MQREEFKRLGVAGDWDDPYTTMDFAAEAAIAGEIGKFLMNGALYRGLQPGDVVARSRRPRWPRPRVEYHDHTSTDDLGAVPAASSRAPRSWPAPSS